MSNTAPWPPMKRGLVAILRGLSPTSAVDTVSVLAEAGFEAIEIPLNSPQPFKSIAKAVEIAPNHCLIGAGTVLATADVERLADAGGRLLVSPNVDADVLARAADLGMVTMPGVFTPTEALSAVAAGASALKFFPASVLGPAGISAIRAVLPADLTIGAVGGVSHDDFDAYSRVGVRTFGLGSSLFKPDMSLREVGARALQTIAAYDHVFGG